MVLVKHWAREPFLEAAVYEPKLQKLYRNAKLIFFFFHGTFLMKIFHKKKHI